jgi:RNA polymerase sigma factor (sigma-70 family)
MEEAIQFPERAMLRVAHNDVLQHTGMSGGPLFGRDCEKLFLESLPLVERLSRHFCRGSRLTPEDVEDFVAQVRVHLLDGDYAVLRAFEGRSTLATFLALVIQRLLLDYRARLWGRFRPSAAASRLGPAAVRLETLLLRDGLPLREAVAALSAHGQELTIAEAERIARELPERKHRGVEIDVSDVNPSEMAVAGDTVERDMTAREHHATRTALGKAMRTAMSALPADDRTILRLHFDAAMPVAAIARSMGLDQRRLYRRLGRLCDVLREQLLQAGIQPADVADLLGRADNDLDFGLREVRNPAGPPSTFDGSRGHS